MPEDNSDRFLIPPEDRPLERSIEGATFCLAILSVPLVLHFHLLPAVFAGLTVHIMTVKIAHRFPERWSRIAHKFALAGLIVLVILSLIGAGMGLWAFFHGKSGMAALLGTVAETLENLRRTLPPDIAEMVPASMEDLREQFTAMLRDNAHRISAAGMAGMRTLVYVLFGMVLGGMTALHHFDPVIRQSSLSTALYTRSEALVNAFDKVVFAQVKISFLNTLFTAVYLLVLLPIAGIHLPLVKVLIPLTFIAGLLPVVGNLVSNTAIVLVSLGVSMGAAAASLAFLASIHKLEYFLNARIVGGVVEARAWELLSAMLVMEAMFGMGGLIAAPIVYAWLKIELKAKHLI